MNVMISKKFQYKSEGINYIESIAKQMSDYL
jgi:hypothetical protein